MRDATAELGGIAGREAELALLREFGRVARGGQALILEGGPGFGKTTLWEGAAELAWQGGRRVLTARASGAETQLSFAALIDVLDGIEGEELAELPPPQAHALDVALFRAPPDEAPPEAHAIGLGLLNALRLLASREPLVIAIDDVQWLDSESAEALAFAARRLTDEPIAFLLARRPGPASALERALDERTLTRVAVGPVTLATVRRILSERLALSLPQHVLRRVFEATLGNPLFALEVGRTLAGSGPPAIGASIPVPATVEDQLGTRVEQLADPVRELLLAVALSADLRVSQLEAIGDPAGLARAVEEGVLVVDGRRVRPGHPLLAAAAIARASVAEQEVLHAKLAAVVVDEERRALHLAHATHRPEEAFAATVAAAAAGAWARGARQEAAALADHALRLTPRGSPERAERLLTLAGYLEVAGDLQRIDELLAPELDSLPPGAARVRGWLLLAEGSSVRSFADLDRHLDAALAECRGDPVLLAHVLTRKADHSAASAVVRIPAAEAWAIEALRAAPEAGPDVERRALMALAWARALRGWAIDDLVERYRSVSDEASYIAASPERVAGQRRVWRGDVHGARATFVRLRGLADERGEPISYALSRLHMCELELRVGRWDDAEHLLDEWAQSSDGALLIWPMYERCRALLAAGRGDGEAAQRWAADALARAEESGAGWDLLEAGRAAGIAALLRHDPAAAAERLGAVWDHLEREGVEEPGAFPVALDLVEAHLALEAPADAALVTRRLRALADQHEHPWARAGAARCEALIALSEEAYDEAAAAALAAAAADFGALGLPVEQARTLLALGRAQRRFKKWGAARESLQASAEAFEALGSPGWAGQALSELDRVGARRPAPSGGLTPTEQRVAELAAEGLSNKEIARTLFVTVHTVEKHLSKAYAKLGIRSRGELGRSLSG